MTTLLEMLQGFLHALIGNIYIGVFSWSFIVLVSCILWRFKKKEKIKKSFRLAHWALIGWLTLVTSLVVFERAGEWSYAENYARMRREVAQMRKARTIKRLESMTVTASRIGRKPGRIVYGYSYQGFAGMLSRSDYSFCHIYVDFDDAGVIKNVRLFWNEAS